MGAGHAGCEAAASAANMGCSTLLVTMNLQNIAQMSCNPAMGGIAKGQIVREIDALGGYSGIVSDKTAIQFKMLNKSKDQQCGRQECSRTECVFRMNGDRCWRILRTWISTKKWLLEFYQRMERLLE